MFLSSPAIKIFLCHIPTDMRCSFDALAMMTQSIIHQDPYSGHLFLFRNKYHDKVKILYWDHDGYVIWYKRLEKGTFRFSANQEEKAEIESGELMLILKGIDLEGSKRQKRFLLKKNEK